PNLLGLRLDTFLAVEDGDGTVEHTQRTLHLNSEVDVAGCVDDVDLVVVPEGGGSSRGNSDTPLLLLLHPVHRRRTLMGLTELVVDPGVEQDPLGGGGLTGVDVGHDADVSDLVEVCQHVTCHLMFPCLKRGTRHWLRSAAGRQRSLLVHCCQTLTNGSERKPCWIRPSCERPRGASRWPRGRCSHRAARSADARSSSSRAAAARK